MTNFAYNRDTPDGPNNPSNDWFKMQINTNNTDDLINEDHVSFGEANGGFHRRVRFIETTIPAIGADQSALYGKASGNSQIWGTTEGGGKEYQLTRFQDADIARFGKYINYSSPGNYTINGGWSFLPGGLLYQYGLVTHSTTIPTGSNEGPFTYAVAFTTSNVILNVTPLFYSGVIGQPESQALCPVEGTVSSTGFQIKAITTAASPSAFKGFYFTAVGV